MAKKKQSVNELRQQELMQLKKELKLSRDDLLQAVQVVKAAKSKRKYPSLHSRFEWDDTRAAHQHRLKQAREMFVEVLVIINDSGPVQAFISLESDQKKPGGGYRETVAVLSDRELRDELLQQVMDEFDYWREKYKHLKELAPIFAAADKVAAKRKQQKSRVKKPQQKKSSRLF